MSNNPDDFVDYYKIKWSRKSAWSLEHAAYLLMGEDPDSKAYEISVHATNSVSKIYHWILNKVNKGYLGPVGKENGTDYFNVGSITRLVETDKRFKIDKDIKKVLKYMQPPFDTKYVAFVTRSTFREAGRLVFLQFPNAKRLSVAAAIEQLPEHFNSPERGFIESRTADQISELLKGFTGLNQKPSEEDTVEVAVDLAKLVEKM